MPQVEESERQPYRLRKCSASTSLERRLLQKSANASKNWEPIKRLGTTNSRKRRARLPAAADRTSFWILSAGGFCYEVSTCWVRSAGLSSQGSRREKLSQSTVLNCSSVHRP